MTGTACYYCGEVVSGRALHNDHLHPKSKGGKSLGRKNLVPACNVCNSIKGDRTIAQMRYRLVQKMIGWPRFTIAQIEWLRGRGFDVSEYDGAKLAFEGARTSNDPVLPPAAQAPKPAPQPSGDPAPLASCSPCSSRRDSGSVAAPEIQAADTAQPRCAYELGSEPSD